MSDSLGQSIPAPQPGGQAGEVPTDLIPAYQAAILLACSTRTLRRRSKAGRLNRYRHPDLTGDFYSRAECDAYRAQFRRAE